MLPRLSRGRKSAPTGQLNPWAAVHQRDLLKAARNCKENGNGNGKGNGKGGGSGDCAESKAKAERLEKKTKTLTEQLNKAKEDLEKTKADAEAAAEAAKAELDRYNALNGTTSDGETSQIEAELEKTKEIQELKARLETNQDWDKLRANVVEEEDEIEDDAYEATIETLNKKVLRLEDKVEELEYKVEELEDALKEERLKTRKCDELTAIVLKLPELLQNVPRQNLDPELDDILVKIDQWIEDNPEDLDDEDDVQFNRAEQSADL